MSAADPWYPPTKPNPFTAATLQDQVFPPLRFVVPGYIVEGLTLLAGTPKLGKSWLVLDIALAKATGGYCLGSVATPQAEDVLYLALEDGPRRLQDRMHRLTLMGEKWPARLTFATEWPRMDQGGLDHIRDWARSVPSPRLVVIDVLQAFRPPMMPKSNPYAADYEALRGIQRLATELNIAVVVVHHVRKSSDQVDPFEKISGTMGLSGAADTALILDRNGQGVTIYGRGRDIPEIETAVRFNRDACRWIAEGPASEVRTSDERKVILDMLKVTDEPATPVTIADATRMPRPNVKMLLHKMAVAGEVTKLKRGLYIHPQREDLRPAT